MEGDLRLGPSYRKRSEEIRVLARGMADCEERTTLLQIAEEYDRAAIVEDFRSQVSQAAH